MDYTDIIKAVITLITAIVSAFLVPYIKSKYSEAQLKKWQSIVDIGVSAAEQLYNTDQAQEKKTYVLKYLYEKGIKLDAETIENLIEASVLHLHDQLYGTTKG